VSTANTLGRYHIIREIARSNDIVYEAMDPSRAQRIALKQLQMPGNLAGQARHERIQRFTREARAAARLQHPNIVRVHDHGNVGDLHYIAMEFLEGQSLRDVLYARGSVPIQEALRIATAVAEGLEYAHKNGVVHRDVKPDNVHLEPDGRVVITDFGIARLMFEPTLTADGQIFGTPSYMSPEQVAGKGVDARSDLFSLGVMLYEMVAGRKPFTGDSVVTITYNIINMEPPPLPGAPHGLDQVIRRAMAKDPSRRYATARELLEDLRALTQGQPPRHALAAPANGSPWPVANGANGSARNSAPARPASAPLPAPAGLPAPPRPLFGGAPASAPGARPLPPRHPATPPAFAGHAAPPYGGPPAAVIGPLPAPAPPPVYQRARPHRSRGGSGAGWLFGWLAVAVIIAMMILVVVWTSVTAFDKFKISSSAWDTEKVRVSADQALSGRKFEEALKGYLAVAQASTGQRRETARLNAAAAATELAQARLDANKVKEAEAFARQALDLNGDVAGAYVMLGQALAKQGQVDTAITAFDEAPEAVRRREAAGATGNELKKARQAADSAKLWKAKTLYDDGIAQLPNDLALARQRLEAAAEAAPTSDFAKNARTQLQRMDVPAGGVPGMSGGTGAAGDPLGLGPAEQPREWDNSYKNFGN
jgi:serine/threonine-protein kinase